MSHKKKALMLLDFTNQAVVGVNSTYDKQHHRLFADCSLTGHVPRMEALQCGADQLS